MAIRVTEHCPKTVVSLNCINVYQPLLVIGNSADVAQAHHSPEPFPRSDNLDVQRSCAFSWQQYAVTSLDHKEVAHIPKPSTADSLVT